MEDMKIPEGVMGMCVICGEETIVYECMQMPVCTCCIARYMGPEDEDRPADNSL